jgi:alcohol dehydrogenase class IV
MHGLDSRFCSVCNKSSAFGRPRGAIGAATLPEVLAFLEAAQVRATYGAVAEVLGVSARAVVAQLGDRGVERGGANVISSGTELVMRMTTWKALRRASPL